MSFGGKLQDSVLPSLFNLLGSFTPGTLSLFLTIVCRFSCARDFEHPFSLVDQFLFQLQVGPESHFVPRRLGRAREFCREVQQVALGRAIEKNEREVLARVNFMPIFGHKFRGSRTRLPFSFRRLFRDVIPSGYR